MIPSVPGLLQAISLFAVAILLARPLGGYMHKVMEGERTILSPVLRPVERGVYKVMRVDETVEQGWQGYAVSVLVCSFVCKSATPIGTFWVYLPRSTLYILLPIAFVGALVLVSQGVIQTFASSMTVHTITGATQSIPLGPVASQEVIKNLGTNGGGFFNANAAHPFESPTGFTNWFEMLLIIIIPFSLTFTFGRMAGNARQGMAILAVMVVVLTAGSLVAMSSEERSNPSIPAAVAQNIDQTAGNMEGKETRFGPDTSGLFATVTTGTSTGAVNSMHDSFLPVGGLVRLFNMELGEITPGGDGAGLFGILVFAIIAVFIAGLMVGRTPEFLGKKIEAYEMKMAMLVVLSLAFSILFFTALATATTAGKAGPLNSGPHGFSEILYAFSSQTGNNGSAFAGLTGNTIFYNITGAFAMML